MGLALANVTLELVSMGECINCGVPIVAPSNFYEQRHSNHSLNFYCVNGHSQHYIGDTDAQKLQKLLDAEKSRHDTTKRWLENEQNSHRATRGTVTKLKKRVAAGVCPGCHRSFQDLKRHMKTKHPAFAEVSP